MKLTTPIVEYISTAAYGPSGGSNMALSFDIQLYVVELQLMVQLDLTLHFNQLKQGILV